MERARSEYENIDLIFGYAQDEDELHRMIPLAPPDLVSYQRWAIECAVDQGSS
jgi:hypothetical protein